MSANPQSSETETAATLVAEYTRVDIMIPSKKKGVEISAWKFLPGGYQKGSKLPVVMGGNGLTLQKSNGLNAYGSHFAKLGYAAVMFDYRYWGGSGGKPRYVVDIASQQEDYKSVLDWVRLQPEFDPEEVILFGSSLGTGHATCLAAKDHRIAAVIGVNPMSNPIKSMNAVIGPNNAPLVPMANLDWLLSLGSRISVFPPIYVKPAHKYDLEKKKPVRKFQLSLVNPGDTAERFAEIAKNSTEGRVDSNIRRRTAFKVFSPPPPYLSIYFSEPYTYKIAARILVTLPLYAPTLKGSKVQCPYFLLISKGEDLILTTRSAKKMALKAPRGSYEIVGDEKSGHFSPYEHTTTGNAVEEICEKAGEFLKRTVPL